MQAPQQKSFGLPLRWGAMNGYRGQASDSKKFFFAKKNQKTW
jgi:hypothetical protein